MLCVLVFSGKVHVMTWLHVRNVPNCCVVTQVCIIQRIITRMLTCTCYTVISTARNKDCRSSSGVEKNDVATTCNVPSCFWEVDAKNSQRTMNTWDIWRPHPAAVTDLQYLEQLDNFLELELDEHTPMYQESVVLSKMDT